jgi:potassium-transporting ATPase KdpC subunit
MFSALRAALVSLLSLTLISGVIYPLTVTVIAQIAFPNQANGSLAVAKGQVIGSTLIGQPFDDPKYFWGRPSATVPYPYNAAASSGSNLGPTNPTLIALVQARVQALHDADPGNLASIPIDLVTTSGSGLDPDISVAAADYQVARVARLRGLDPARVRSLVEQSVQDRQFGVLGEPRVNVLAVNLALDALR